MQGLDITSILESILQPTQYFYLKILKFIFKKRNLIKYIPLKIIEQNNIMETTFTYKGYTINIKQDEEPMNPRTEWDNLGTMICFHNRYDLGDKHSFTLDYAKSVEANNSNLYIILPLFFYDHSGITISTKPFTCPWDSGQVGIIYISKEKVRKEYGWKKITKAREEQIKIYLEGEVETYDNYLTGEVYLYEIEETGDSCGSFYGNYEQSGILDEAKNSIDCSIIQQCEEV